MINMANIENLILGLSILPSLTKNQRFKHVNKKIFISYYLIMSISHSTKHVFKHFVHVVPIIVHVHVTSICIICISIVCTICVSIVCILCIFIIRVMLILSVTLISICISFIVPTSILV